MKDSQMHLDKDSEAEEERREGKRGQARRMMERNRDIRGGVESLVVRGKKAAHCVGERRTGRKEAIVAGEPLDSSTDKPHILEEVRKEEEVQPGRAVVIR